jgi:hypothetical protein
VQSRSTLRCAAAAKRRRTPEIIRSWSPSTAAVQHLVQHDSWRQPLSADSNSLFPLSPPHPSSERHRIDGTDSAGILVIDKPLV